MYRSTQLLKGMGKCSIQVKQTSSMIRMIIVLVYFVNIMVVGNIAWWTTIFSKTMDIRSFFLGSGQGLGILTH